MRTFLFVIGGAIVGFAAGLFVLFPLFSFFKPAASAEVLGWSSTFIGVVGGVIGGAWFSRRW